MICPKCKGAMRTVGLGKLGTTIEVERCGGCGGMFFDSGETELHAALSEKLGKTIAAGPEPPDMTVLDLFALGAMVGLVSNGLKQPEAIAVFAYQQAIAMIAEKAKLELLD